MMMVMSDEAKKASYNLLLRYMFFVVVIW